jgi:hypothetical protein
MFGSILRSGGVAVFAAVGFVACAAPMEGEDTTDEVTLELQDYGTYDTTYYPYGNEYWSHTVCGSTSEFGGYFFAVTEQSPLWSGTCVEAWNSCDNNPRCRDYWNQIPEFYMGQRIKDPSTRRVLEPACYLGSQCGKQVNLSYNGRTVPGRVWDACPAMHWNNVLAERLYGKNPCARGSRHVDLWRTLYSALGGNGNGNLANVRITDIGYGSGPSTPPSGGSGGYVCDASNRDRQPSPEYSCAQQKSWGKCNESWMTQNGGYCNATCGRCTVAPPPPPPPPSTGGSYLCDASNRDRQPSPEYSCAQQKSWGKCNESWMTKNGGYCNATCGRCR